MSIEIVTAPTERIATAAGNLEPPVMQNPSLCNNLIKHPYKVYKVYNVFMIGY